MCILHYIDYTSNIIFFRIDYSEEIECVCESHTSLTGDFQPVMGRENVTELIKHP